MAFLQSDQDDSALAAAQEFYERYPQSKSGGLLLSLLLSQIGKQREACAILSSLAERYPTDFNVLLKCGHCFQVYAEQENDDGLRYVAQTYYNRATKVNRYRGAFAKEMWDRTEARLRRPKRTTGP